MPKESFLYPETKLVFDLVEEASRRSGVSRGQAFEDFLHMSVCALSGGQMEDQYLATVKRHVEGKSGKRGCDSLAQAFGVLVRLMDETRQDVLGDLFQGGITYGEAGQFLTPEPICEMLARMTIGEEGEGEEEGSAKRTVCDPCVGSGRMLLAVAKLKPHWEFIGQDVDLRCVRMTAINLALRNLYGYVIWGNSLGVEKKLVYRTGFNLRGFIRELTIDQCPAPVQQVAAETQSPDQPLPDQPSSSSSTSEPATITDEIEQSPPTEKPPAAPLPPAKQLRFF